MTGLKHDAIETTLINEALNQRDLEGKRVAITVRRAFTEHRYVAMTKVFSRSGESSLILLCYESRLGVYR